MSSGERLVRVVHAITGLTHRSKQHRYSITSGAGSELC